MDLWYQVENQKTTTFTCKLLPSHRTGTYPHATYGSTIRSIFSNNGVSLTNIPVKVLLSRSNSITLLTLLLTPLILSQKTNTISNQVSLIQQQKASDYLKGDMSRLIMFPLLRHDMTATHGSSNKGKEQHKFLTLQSAQQRLVCAPEVQPSAQVSVPCASAGCHLCVCAMNLEQKPPGV